MKLLYFAPSWCVGSDERAGVSHRRRWLSLSGFMCLLGIGKNEPRFLVVPVASELVFIGPVGSSHLHAPRSGRRLNLNQKAPVAFVYGVVRVHCVVVRTTEMIAIHSSGVTCCQRRYLSTKRKIVLTSMRALVLWQLRRPAENRQVKSRIAASDCGVWLWRWNSGTRHIGRSDPGFHRQRRRT